MGPGAGPGCHVLKEIDDVGFIPAWIRGVIYSEFSFWLEAQLGILGRIYGRSLDFSFGGRTENGHEVVFELVSGVDLMYVPHIVLNLTHLKGSWAKFGRKKAQN